MMNDLTGRRRALEEKIHDLEDTLTRLKAQLKAEAEREQHDTIDRLDEYLGELDNKHASLQEFFKVLREDVKALLGTGNGSAGRGV